MNNASALSGEASFQLINLNSYTIIQGGYYRFLAEIHTISYNICEVQLNLNVVIRDGVLDGLSSPKYEKSAKLEVYL